MISPKIGYGTKLSISISIVIGIRLIPRSFCDLILDSNTFVARRDRSIAEISAWPRLNPIHFLPALISAWQTHKSAPIVITHPDTNIDGLYRSVDLHGSQFKERVTYYFCTYGSDDSLNFFASKDL